MDSDHPIVPCKESHEVGVTAVGAYEEVSPGAHVEFFCPIPS